MAENSPIIKPKELVAFVNSDSNDGSRWKNCIYVVLISGFIVVGVIAVILLALLKPRHQYIDEYGVVFDAGSTHTSLYVYKWNGNERLNGTAVPVDEVYTNKIEPGLSSFVEDPDKAGDSLKDLVRQASNKVPDDVKSSTPVFLGATAGMRLLYNVSHSISNQIMSSVCKVLSQSGFQFSDENAEIITGEDEGAFGWITVNYLENILQNTKAQEPSIGALDLGGASTQISFVPKNASKATENFYLYGRDYPVYMKTYLCYGLNEIYRRFLAELAKSLNYTMSVPNPCTSTDSSNITLEASYLWGAPCSCKPSHTVNHNFTFYGALNSTECTKKVTELFYFNDTCSNATVFSRGNHPGLQGNFFAFSGYYYVAKNLGVSLSPTKEQFEAGYEKVCSQNKEAYVYKGTFSIAPDIPVCFAGQYVYALLTYGYGFNNKTWNVSFKKKVDNKDVGWALGYMINATNLIPKNAPKNVRLRDEVLIPALVCSGIFILIGLILCAKCAMPTSRNGKNAGYTPI